MAPNLPPGTAEALKGRATTLISGNEETGMFVMKRIPAALAGLLCLLGAQPVLAQTSQNATATITIVETLYVSVTNTTVTFNTPTSAQFLAGNIGASSGASVLDHGGNVTHTVQLQSSSANMVATIDPVNNIKPASDLQWSSNGGTSWNSLSTTAANLRTSIAKGNYPAAATVTYRMLLNFANAPDTYTLNFTYTVVAG
jgi:hypothetical protein